MDVEWRDAGELSIKWAAECGSYPGLLQKALDAGPPSLSAVYLDLESKRAHVATDQEDRSRVVLSISSILPVAERDELHSWRTVKVAETPFLKNLATAMNYQHGSTFGIPSYPASLVGTLTSGLVGAGLGYGAGAVAENLLPAAWERNKLRRTLAMAGGLGGTAIGLPWIYSDIARGRNIAIPHAWETKQADWSNSAGTAGLSKIPVDSFNRVIWGDPRVADHLPAPTQAVASGLVTAASSLGGRRRSYVTPADVASIAVGMGSGYLSGSLLGHGFGTLMGMPQETQETLKNTGMWAGAVQAFVNNAFGE